MMELNRCDGKRCCGCEFVGMVTQIRHYNGKMVGKFLFVILQNATIHSYRQIPFLVYLYFTF